MCFYRVAHLPVLYVYNINQTNPELGVVTEFVTIRNATPHAQACAFPSTLNFLLHTLALLNC